MSEARSAVLEQLAHAHDRWSEEEQRQANTIEAAGAHEFALRVLRAYRAELDDPEPLPVPDVPSGQLNYWEWLRRGMGR